MQRTQFSGNLRRQGGATLLVGLIILLLMTFIGLAAIRGSGMQELMAGNMRDRQLAFQAAEAGLRVAEADLTVQMAKAASTRFNGLTPGYQEEMGGSSNTGYWLEDFDWPLTQPMTTDLGLEGLASQPVYVVERITEKILNSGSDGGSIDYAGRQGAEPSQYYRVTSRGVGGTDTAVVILQSNFQPF